MLLVPIKTKEAHEPRIPMTICKQTFQLVDKHLSTLSYDGSVGLNCDDTKLFQLWDAKKKAHFMVGGVGEPMHVADPDRLKEIINDAKLVKATKVGQTTYLRVFTDKLIFFRCACGVYKPLCQELH
jgi:hypothetical protein